MQNKLFIGNLSFNMNEQDLRDHFEPFGTISEIAIPKNRETGRSRGFAFVTYSSEEEAKNALQQDGVEVQGRAMRVSIATGEKRAAGTGGRGRDRD